jgi:hypothetical protein
MTSATTTHDCRSCIYLSRESEGWEHPEIFWYECRERPGLANLRSFPFTRTKCASYKPRAQAGSPCALAPPMP